MLPAATLGVPHDCPAHGPGTVIGPCCPRVRIGNFPAARITDLVICPGGPPAVIVGGNPTVLIGNFPAARETDPTSHGGQIANGCARVLIGEPQYDADGHIIKIAPECAFLKKGSTVEGPESDFKQHASPTTIGPGTPTTHTFPGDSSPRPAVVQTVDVRGRQVQVYTPTDGDAAGKNLPNAQQVGNGLGGLSDEQLDRLHNVEVSPNPNPDDADWAKKYNQPDFHSGARGGDGGITFFPEAMEGTPTLTQRSFTRRGTSMRRISGKTAPTRTPGKPQWTPTVTRLRVTLKRPSTKTSPSPA